MRRLRSRGRCVVRIFGRRSWLRRERRLGRSGHIGGRGEGIGTAGWLVEGGGIGRAADHGGRNGGTAEGGSCCYRLMGQGDQIVSWSSRFLLCDFCESAMAILGIESAWSPPAVVVSPQDILARTRRC